MAKRGKTSLKRKPKGRGKVMIILAVLSVLVVAAGVVLIRSGVQGPERSKTAGREAYVRKETRPTLAPALFVGKAAEAYQVARDIPDVLDHLYCYCQCDKHFGHKSLLSCFADSHGSNCDICMEEALEASRLHGQGVDAAQIRDHIDRKYAALGRHP